VRRFLARRLTHGAAVVLIAASLAFVLVHIAPGDPFSTLNNDQLDPRVVEAWRTAYGIDRPLPQQFYSFFRQLAVGNLGLSVSYGRPVSEVLARALPNTLLLMGVALLISFTAGIAIGAWQAMHRDSVGDRVTGTTSLVIGSLPEFWLGLVLMVVFAEKLHWLPAGGMVDPLHNMLSTGGRIVDRIRHIVLPALTLGLLGTAAIARYQRAALLDVLPQDFIRTARAKGIAERWVVYRHALRNALVPTIVLVGLSLPTLLGGAVFVETLYAWNGMGSLAAAAFFSRDYYLVLGAVLVGSVMVVVGGILTDVLHAVVDPRVRAR
jgi:peptide/nickel transport system permease protein